MPSPLGEPISRSFSANPSGPRLKSNPPASSLFHAVRVLIREKVFFQLHEETHDGLQYRAGLHDRLGLRSQGLLEVPGAQVHQYLVHDLSCRGLAGAPPYEEIPVGSRAAKVPTLEVTRGTLVRGRLLDAAGEPLANRQLWLERLLPELDGDFMNHDEVTTDAEGRYEFRGVPPGASACS